MCVHNFRVETQQQDKREQTRTSNEWFKAELAPTFTTIFNTNLLSALSNIIVANSKSLCVQIGSHNKNILLFMIIIRWDELFLTTDI